MCNSCWQNCSTVGSTVVQSLAWLFNSLWVGYSTVTGTIVQQSLAQLFNSHWHNYSTTAGTIVQQSLAWLFNSHWHDFFFFLCWQNSSIVMFTVEALCHVPGIRHICSLLSHSKLLQHLLVWFGQLKWLAHLASVATATIFWFAHIELALNVSVRRGLHLHAVCTLPNTIFILHFGPR